MNSVEDRTGEERRGEESSEWMGGWIDGGQSPV